MTSKKLARCKNCEAVIEPGSKSCYCETCRFIYTPPKKGRVNCLNCNRRFRSQDVTRKRICLYCKNHLQKFKDGEDLFSSYGFDSFCACDSFSEVDCPDSFDGVIFGKAD